MLDFRLFTFLALCHHKSYTKTAAALSVTQPAVTQHIQALEREYGVKLFQYRNKQLSLTPQGVYLQQTAQTMLRDVDQIVRQLQAFPTQRLPLRLGATLTIGEFVLPPILDRYIQQYPDVPLSMQMGNTALLLDALRAGTIDFAFIEGYFDQSAFDFQVFQTDHFVAVCAPNANPPTHIHRLDALLEQPLLLRESGSGTREILERALLERGLNLQQFSRKVCIGNLNVIKQLVAAGRGITFLYRAAVAKELEAGTLRELEIDDFHVLHDYTFVTLKGSMFQPEYRAFLDFAQTCAVNGHI